MIVAAVMGLMTLFGGGAGTILPADFDKRVEQHVPEGARRDSIQAVAKELEAIGTDYQKQADDNGDALVALSKDYESDTDSLVALLDEAREERQQAADGIVQKRLQLAELLTAEEWAAVFAEAEDGK
jgi:Skp family chaperone for outer membrane proteins